MGQVVDEWAPCLKVYYRMERVRGRELSSNVKPQALGH